MAKIQAIRGMNDILPQQIPLWQYFENTAKSLLTSYGYQEVRLPIVEKSELFHRGVGDGTDIVEKETYDFTDRSDEKLTLRPEGTAGCVRAVIEHGMVARNQIQKLWYMGPMYRYERPQKGRYRQFYQFGVEVYGHDSITQDAELLALSWRFWQALGLDKNVTLQINNLGTNEDREKYKQALISYLTPIKNQLDEDSQRRLTKNPLRILDSKNQTTQALLENAPKLDAFLSTETKGEFQKLYTHLKTLNIPVTINPHLVRGLDYYSHTVFEWVTEDLGAQGTICAGGRYNSLVENLGGPQTPAVGFAMGIERIILLLQEVQQDIKTKLCDIYVISDDKAIFNAIEFTEKMREAYPLLQIEQNHTLGSFKSQFKKADKSGAKLALIIAENECDNKTCTIKFLREDKDQITLPQDEALKLIDTLVE